MASQHQSTKEVWNASVVDGFPWLFVGSLSAAENHSQLKAHHVTRLLTIAGRLNVPKPPCIHVTIEIDDHPLANILEAVQKCVGIFEEASKDAALFQGIRPPSLLVHCASGISRSVSSIVAWLMIRRDYSLDDALEAIRVNRPLANPNVGFMQQLQMLQKHCGDLEAAHQEWQVHSQKDIWELTSVRRRLANDLHAQVDDLEVRIQQCISRKENKSDVNLLREANAISDRLDQAKGETREGLPLDKVTEFIFKSARSKLERLLDQLK